MSNTATLVLEWIPEAKRWRGTSPSIPELRTDGITLRATRNRATHELRRVVPPASIKEVVILPDPWKTSLEAFHHNRALNERLTRELPQQRVEVAQLLIQLQMTVSDAARLLKLSPAHLAQTLRPDVRRDQHPETRADEVVRRTF